MPAVLLPRGTGTVRGSHDPHAVGQTVGTAIGEQTLDRLLGERRWIERVGTGDGGAHGGRGALTVVAPLPAGAAAADEHPATAVGRHVAIERLRRHEGGR